MNQSISSVLILGLLTSISLAGCAIETRISYQGDVYPIFEDKCIGCHTPPFGEGYRKTGLDLGSYEALLQGSIYGPVIVPGNSKNSALNMLVEGRAGDLSRTLEMQHKPMTDHEIEVLRLWVGQGARNN